MKMCTTKKMSKVYGKIKGTIIATPKDSVTPKKLISVVKGTCSDGNKEKVVTALDNFFSNTTFIRSSTYRDKHSRTIVGFLNKKFPNVTWNINSSQHPFDCYSVDARIAIENKTNIACKTSHGNSVRKSIPCNASIYPTKAKVKDVIPIKEYKKYTSDELNSFMDVIVTFVDHYRDTNELVSYAIVDGSYWNIDYKTYKGCTSLFNTMNNKNVIKAIFNVLHIAEPKNKFIERINDNDESLEDVTLSLRKLICVANPTYEVINSD